MILDSSRFLSYFGIVATAIFGALNDNLLKSAIIVYAAMSVPAEQAATTGLLAGGLLMLPFVLFSGWAGIVADKFEKAKVIRAVKVSELVLSVSALAIMLSGSVPAMLAIVFLMGTQSAFFGPLKLGWLPERLDRDQLTGANAWLETGTFLAILAGTVAGGILAGAGTLLWAGVASIVVALIGIYWAWQLPVTKAAAPNLHMPLNPLTGNWRILKTLISDRTALKAAILSTWFWAAGAVYLSTLPAYLRMQLGGGEVMMTLVMALFAIGIGAGSFFASMRLKGRVGASLLVPSSVLVTAAAFGVYAGFDRLQEGAGMAGLIATPEGLFVVASLFTLAFGGGMFAVPLKAIIQSRAGAGERAQVMAGFNILNALGITAASGMMSVGVSAGMGLSDIFLVVAESAILALVGAVAFFPRAALQWIGRVILKTWFRLEIEGAENLSVDGPVVYVANHTSFADGPLLFSLIDREVDIAVNTGWAKGRLLKGLAKTLKIAPLDPQRPMAAKGLAQEIREGGAALIFPEGRISTHGALMKTYPGSAWMVDAARAPVVPVHIEGLESSIFTRRIPGMARRLFPKVRVRVGKPVNLEVAEDLKGRVRREAATRALQGILEKGRFEALSQAGTIPEAFHEARALLSRNDIAATDPMGTNLSRKKIAVGAAAFSALLQEKTEPGERVGVLLPGVAAAPVVLMGLWRAARVPAILNPTLGAGPMRSAIETAGIKRILTSRAFVEQAKISETVDELVAGGIEILWTDDLKEEIGLGAKVKALIASRQAADIETMPNDPAVVLFTSGTEGAPKGVVLTHANLIANVAQVRSRTDISVRDRMLNAMPLFHSFGLTAGVLLPLISGVSVMMYPSPLHYRIVPEMAYAHRATIVLGTDTFLAGWGRRASAYDFATVRAAIAGAEPVKSATRAMWAEKFGVRILEGYGATEAGPIVALNTPMEAQTGTVGRPMTNLETRLEPVPGIDGKRLWIRGPNIMAGYLLHGQGDTIHAPEEGWYDTGDIVQIDDAGFIRIVGRAKRFAKVGGEMVSLAAAEVLAAQAWPDAHVAAIALKDARKGEKVVLVTDQTGASRKELSGAAKAQGVAEITVPAEVLVMDRIPLLASGKTDYPALTARIVSTEETAA